MTLEQLFLMMGEQKASDLFLAPGSPVTIKVDGVCVPVSTDRLSGDDVGGLLARRLSAEHLRILEDTGELNMTLPMQPLGNFRLSAFRQRGQVSAVLRHIPAQVPALDELALPSLFKDLALCRHGLVLVTGAAGSGKSTSIASMLDYRNQKLSGHILTVEDPIEFHFQSRKSIVSQRQIGIDTQSLPQAMANAMRQSPDVLFFGEIRDADTMSAAMAYALSGHLVMATLHATNCANAVSRITHFFPAGTRDTLFEDIGTCLRAMVCQRLVRSSLGGRLPAVEVLSNTGRTHDLIVRGDLSSIKDALAQSLAPENRSFEQSLYQLLLAGRISRDEALANADSQSNLLWLINNSQRPAATTPTPPPAPAAPPDATGASFTDFNLSL